MDATGRQFATLVLCQGAITVGLAPLTIRRRSSAHLTVRLASELSYGQKTDKSATSVRCLETRQVKLLQLIMPARSLGTRKVQSGLRAFIWTEATGMQNIGALPGGNASRALAINDAGCVVGSSSTSSGDHAFIWTKQEGMTDLNSAASAGLGVVFAEAHAINNAGQILILGKAMPETDSSGRTAHSHHDCAVAPATAFLLTPVAGK